jgi:glycosyltransferase involved in cell wall biosynthesis
LNKKIIVSVISDIVTDQRVQKECNTLYKMGYNILVIGRKSNTTFLLKELPYKIIRFSNPFRRGPFVYFVFNIQLFFYLLFKRSHILWANDLDTLLPNFLISRLKKTQLVYDSHEYFIMSVYKKSSKKIWHRLERSIFPHLKNVITVNDSIKQAYEKEYKIPVTVIRNVPYKNVNENQESEVIFPNGKKILIMQGMGLNENRGAEEAILMMQFLPEDFMLYFIGGGTIWNKLKEMVLEMHLSPKVIFIDVIPYHEMMKYTRQSFLGLIFEKIYFTDQHMFALPNKFFDYMHAGIPVLSSKAVEIKSLIEKYNTGDFIDSFEPEKIAEKIIEISNNEELYNLWKHNTCKASEELNWETEEKILVNFMQHLR